MPRLFIALDMPAAVRDTLVALRTDDPGSSPGQALDGARWTRPEQLHCTLRFLGDTPEKQISDLKATLARIDASPLALRLDGLTAFPSRRRPRVLVARIAPTDALMNLQRQIEAAVQRLGFEPESRPFRPHVTVARLKRADARAVHDWLRAHTVETAFTADTVHLYASVLKPTGAVHERLASFALHASG